MARKRYKPEEIVAKLRQVDVLAKPRSSQATSSPWVGKHFPDIRGGVLALALVVGLPHPTHAHDS
jgi:hypothetical protein